jgi:hypothetical protein
MKKLFIIICFTFLSISVTYCSTVVPSVISANQTWNAAGSPYLISQNSAILSGANVTVLPGVEIQGGFNITLTIHGGFVCLGKVDSMITINQVLLAFQPTSPDYNPSNGSGNRIIFTRFSPLTGSAGCISSLRNNLLIDHCFFDGFLYCVNAADDSIKLWIKNSRFRGGKDITHPIYKLTKNSVLEFTGNTVEGAHDLWLAEKNTVSNNYFTGGSNAYGINVLVTTVAAEISCNNFKNTYYGIYAANLSSSVKTINIHNNNFDSCKYTLDIGTGWNVQDSVKFHNNNLRNYTKSVFAVSGGGSGSFTWFNMSSNYWGTTDTSVIISGIYDNRSSAIVTIRVNFSKILTAPVTPCWPEKGSTLFAKQDFEKSLFLLYPNPARDICNISVRDNGVYSIIITDFYGKVFSQKSFSGNQYQINLQNLTNGSYLIFLTDKNGQRIGKQLCIQN